MPPSAGPLPQGARQRVVPNGLVLPLPSPGPGVCRHCHGPAGRHGALCYCCAVLCSRLAALAPVVPVGVCVVPGPFHTVLRSYKDGTEAGRRRWCAALLAEILGGFLDRHTGCLEVLAGHPLSRAVLVPPGRRRGTSPMEGVAVAAGDAVPPLVPALCQADDRHGPAHLRADPVAYRVAEAQSKEIRGRGVLLLDDTLTTGASAQSAAAALRGAGAAAVVIVVLGRVVRPTASAAQRQYMELVTGAARRTPPFTPGDPGDQGDPGCPVPGCPSSYAARASPGSS